MPFTASLSEIRSLLSATERLSTADASPGNNIVADGVTTDSRDVKKGALFVARKGEASDGHLYVRSAFQQGAAACLVDADWLQSASAAEALERLRTEDKISAPLTLLGVGDTTTAFGDLARYWRRKLALPTLTVSGSNGKTTTKEMLRVLLTAIRGPGTASAKSYNNHIGLPQTILNASTTDRWLLLEAGMNHAGELDYLGSIATPDVALLLNIGPEHIGFFEGLEDVADAECEIFGHLSADGRAVLNGSDEVLLAAVRRFEEQRGKRLGKVFFGDLLVHDCFFSSVREAPSQAALMQGERATGSRFLLHLSDQACEASIPLLGRHNVLNATAAALGVVTAFPEVTIEQIAQVLPQIEGAPMRLEVHQLERFTLINDAYNANPASMKVALETAVAAARNRSCVAILGDMLELGAQSERYHTELGERVAQSGVARLIARGQFASFVVEGAKRCGLTAAVVAVDDDETLQLFEQDLPSDLGVVLVKGSRGVALESVVRLLQEKFNALPSAVPAA